MQSGASYRRHGKAGKGPALGGRPPGNRKELPMPPLSPGTLPAPTQRTSLGRSSAQRAVSSRLNAFQKAERSGGRGRAQKPRPRSITGHGTSLHHRPPPGRPRRGAASSEAPHRAAGGWGRRSPYGSGARRGRRSACSPPTPNSRRGSMGAERLSQRRARPCAANKEQKCAARSYGGATHKARSGPAGPAPRGERGEGGGRPRAPPAATRPRGERRGGAA